MGLILYLTEHNLYSKKETKFTFPLFFFFLLSKIGDGRRGRLCLGGGGRKGEDFFLLS